MSVPQSGAPGELNDGVAFRNSKDEVEVRNRKQHCETEFTGFGVSKIQPRSLISLLINYMALGILAHLCEPQFPQSENNCNHTASLQCGCED